MEWMMHPDPLSVILLSGFGADLLLRAPKNRSPKRSIPALLDHGKKVTGSLRKHNWQPGGVGTVPRLPCLFRS